MSRRRPKPDGSLGRKARGVGGARPYRPWVENLATLDVTCGWPNPDGPCDNRLVRLFVDQSPDSTGEVGWEGDTLSRVAMLQEPLAIYWHCGCGMDRGAELPLETCRQVLAEMVASGTRRARVSAVQMMARTL